MSNSKSNVLRSSKSKNSNRRLETGEHTYSGVIGRRSGSKSKSRSKKARQDGDHEIIRNLINRKMSQVRMRLKDSSGKKTNSRSGRKGTKGAIRSHRVLELGGNLDTGDRSRSRGYKDKLSACRELLDKISVSLPFDDLFLT